MMILPAKLRHKEQIIALWNSAFGDKTKDVEKYLKTLLEYFLVYEEDGILKGMLSVLPVSFGNKIGGYIYAVTTDKNHRGQGICNKLMEYVKEDKSYNFLVLKPQNDGLFEFYGKMGFERVPQLEKKEFWTIENSEVEYQLKQLSAKDYEFARNSYFAEEIIKWDENMLSFAKDMYNGEFYAIEEKENRVGWVFCYKDKSVAVIKEIVANKPQDIANFVACELDCKKVKYAVCNENGSDGFMIYPKALRSGYFNIYLD